VGADEYDLVFSNSVIEHCSDYESQVAMAAQIRAPGLKYWVQTPNFWFPMEPHFLVPGFHWLPLTVRALLVRLFPLGFHNRRKDFKSAIALVKSVRLLSARQMQRLFPGGELYREKLFGVTKSLVMYGQDTTAAAKERPARQESEAASSAAPASLA